MLGNGGGEEKKKNKQIRQGILPRVIQDLSFIFFHITKKNYWERRSFPGQSSGITEFPLISIKDRETGPPLLVLYI